MALESFPVTERLLHVPYPSSSDTTSTGVEHRIVRGPAKPIDPRWYQIAVLSSLLVAGVARLGFDVSPPQIVVTIVTALCTQLACERVTGSSRREWKSALISSLSLCLLLRTDHLAWAALASIVAVASKFVLRVRGKHVLNPTNGAIVLMLAVPLALGLEPPVWVSPAQWGHLAWFGFLMASLGTVVVTRAARADVTFAFLAFWAALVFGRATWLGQPPATPAHMLQNGGLLLFAFFMISDPKTTPDSRAGRIVFALLVALGAGLVQFVLWRTNGLLWSLAACSLFVPLIDRVCPGERFAWDRAAASTRPGRGDVHVPDATPMAGRSRAAHA